MAQSSVWRESVGVDGTFELLSEKEQVDMEKITIRRYMEVVGQHLYRFTVSAFWVTLF